MRSSAPNRRRCDRSRRRCISRDACRWRSSRAAAWIHCGSADEARRLDGSPHRESSVRGGSVASRNLMANCYNLVGFQNHLRFSEQKRVFRMIPGLARAEFLRFGQIHRNTYSNPRIPVRDASGTGKAGAFFRRADLRGGGVHRIGSYGTAGRHKRRAFGPGPGIRWCRLARRGAAASFTILPMPLPRVFQPVNINFGILSDATAGSRYHSRIRRKDIGPG